MAIEELEQQGSDVAAAEPSRCGDRQRALRLLASTGESGFGSVQFGQRASAVAQKDLTVLCQSQTARASLDQQYAQVLLQRGHRPSGRWR